METFGGLAMAKKKAAPKLEKTWTSKPVAFQVRGNDDYKAAVEAFAEAEGKSVAALADHAIRAYARQVGYSAVIPKR